MAYGNWGAFVYKNGERQTAWEDATPYREAELPSGYWQAWNRTKDADSPNPHHAVLGQDRVRLCGYKCYPVLFVDGKNVELTAYGVGEPDEYGDVSQWKGEIDGYKFSAEFDGENMIALELVEPDGTKWTSRCGFEYGAGHMDLNE